MTDASQKAYYSILEKLNEECKSLSRANYYEVLEELSEYVDACMNCVREEQAAEEQSPDEAA